MRPCGIFGDTPAESILMNNAAWVLRRSPLFLTAGDGGQPFQPVHVRDMAALMVELGQSTDTSGEELDACGPDAPTALELFTALRDATGAPARVAPVGGWLSNATLTALTRPIDWVTGDTLLDADDLDLLGSGAAPRRVLFRVAATPRPAGGYSRRTLAATPRPRASCSVERSRRRRNRELDIPSNARGDTWRRERSSLVTVRTTQASRARTTPTIRASRKGGR